MINFTDRVYLRLNNSAPDIPKLDIVKKIWWFQDGKWAPQGFSAHGDSYLTLTEQSDNPPTEPNIDLFEITVQEGAEPHEPLLVVDRGFVAQKDISAGGFIASNQGELYLGSGRNDQVDVPKIILTHSDVSRLQGGGSLEVPAIPSGSQFPAGEKGQLFIYTPTSSLYKHNGSTWVYQGPTSNYAGYFDTLYLRKANAQDPAHLDVGDINIHGHLSIGNTVTSDLNPDPNHILGNDNNRWLSMVAENVKVNSLNPIPAGVGGNGTWIDVNTKLRINGDLQLNNGHVVSSLNPSGSIALGSPSEPWTGVVAITGYFNNLRSPDGNIHIDDTMVYIYGSWHFQTGYVKTDNIAPAWQSSMTIWSHMNPISAGQYGLGSGSQYWAGVVADTFYAHWYGWFDALDDLELLKGTKSKTITQEGMEVDVIDPNSLPFLLRPKREGETEDFWDVGKSMGFMVGVAKQHLARTEKLEQRVAALEKALSLD
ncbi:MAG: hypothetical protein NWE99_04165 [Candidatus Bathyarchaeota archaeon]|nr:hypothetical protein [Candidatus Bathyarchaeota archaeon]